ncbi:MAG: sigma-70 family RNA polymerase sigma factor [Phycisphaerae bacterium]|nr:sigma-70 family RNA polymerase sigma factor [Phycisphaerae bacterium]
MNDRSDKDLVVSCLAEDKSAYKLLVRKHYKRVFLTCLGILGNVHDAEDMAQDTMLKGYIKIGMLRDGSKFGPWTARIAKSLCINFIRRKKYAKKIVAERIIDANRSVNQYDNLQLAIEQLPQETRAPLVMYYFDGQSVKKVAERLEMSKSTVYLKLRTAITELHNLLAKQGDSK